ncbi:M1 family metallopeptidase [Sulfuracidifex tepidarius]|uniref:Aminopeptidase n=1 Tax=Sulfuracidifex tepidarius TaxID=1294262 RepID=A0A510DZC0_9CREN|nr:M1 family metallopeptidase [Sulfuracidifex tepidarius]BBG22748.1 Leucyl aminopeptidase [Sulfuracidifex tepidarius]BBG25527.1 Leucyl aminopeptidase [Sulfuracidifex tepidarius]
MQVKRYDIDLDFDFKNLKYDGYEKISLEGKGNVELDAVDFNLHQVKVNGETTEFEYDGKTIKINATREENIIEIWFSKKVDDKQLTGIYKAKYDQDKYVISTQFEATHARDFIPCIDKPSYKSIFRIQVKVDQGLKVLSNMDAEISKSGEKVLYSFKETPKMSTYLLYLGIGDFEEVEDNSSSPKIIVATTPGKSAKGRFAIEVARKTISFYENYFGIKYQLPKEHLIAVPEFAFGAMENWGAITFRENALLADESSSTQQKIRVSEVVAHELAHQWFGDLVTMKWWDDLWLNESFATFMSHKAVNETFPEWRMWESFLIGETSPAMLKDALNTTHSIEAHVENEAEIEQMFDDISYGKGASVLRMIEAYLAPENFRKGISSYLKKFQFSNASGQDLWNSLSEASGEKLDQIMDSWIKKPGYPLLTVQIIKGTRGYRLAVRQDRFLLNGKDDLTYIVPLTFRLNGRKETSLLEERTYERELESYPNELLVNIDRTGFYRVVYEDLNLAIKSVRTPLEAWELLNDYFYLLISGKIGLETYEKVLKAFASYRSPLVSNEIAEEMKTLFAVNPSKYGDIVREVLQTSLKLWVRPKERLEKMAFSNVASTLAMADEGFALGLSRLMDNYDYLDGDLRQPVAISFAVSEEDNAFEVLLNKFRKANLDEEKLRLLNAMLSFRKGYLVTLTLGLFSTGEIKKQDIVRILPRASSNPFAREAVWSWLKLNIERIREIYSGTGIFGRVLSDTIPLLGIGMEEEISNYFKAKQIKEGERGIKIGLEILSSLSRLS